MQETWVWSLGWEDPLEKGIASHSSVLAWRIPWTEEPGGLQFMGSQRVRHNWATSMFTLLHHWVWYRKKSRLGVQSPELGFFLSLHFLPSSLFHPSFLSVLLPSSFTSIHPSISFLSPSFPPPLLSFSMISAQWRGYSRNQAEETCIFAELSPLERQTLDTSIALSWMKRCKGLQAQVISKPDLLRV